MFFKGQSFVKGDTKVSGRGRKRDQCISNLDVIEWRTRTELGVYKVKNGFILIEFQTIKDYPSVYIRNTFFNAALH